MTVATAGARADDSLDILGPDPWHTALFLDVDGTLIDMADRPDAVVMPPGLPQALARLSERLDGALALVTGRSVAFVDALLGPLRLPMAGLHGAEWRLGTGEITRPDPAPGFDAARERVREALAPWPGVLFEDKGGAFAAHFRLAPEREWEVAALMQSIAAGIGEGYVLQPGKAVIELRPAGRDKGAALTAFMVDPPFAGRRPVAFGDDVTDEAMFAAATQAGGMAVLVGDRAGPTRATARLPSPAALRGWIERMAS